MKVTGFPNIDVERLERNSRIVLSQILADPRTPADLRDILSRKKFISDLPKSERQAAIESTGSAMCPVESDYIVIGFFGSVWCDCRYQGRLVRIAINPNPAASNKYAVTELE